MAVVHNLHVLARMLQTASGEIPNQIT